MKSPHTPIHTIEYFKDQEFYDWLVVLRSCCHVICYLKISLLENKLENVQMCIFFTHNKEDAMLQKRGKEHSSFSFSSLFLPKLRIFIEMFCANSLSPAWSRHVGHHCCVPTWQPENSVHIWNLRWQSRRLIIRNKQTDICKNIFSNSLTLKKAKNHKISVYFFTNTIGAACHSPPQL